MAKPPTHSVREDPAPQSLAQLRFEDAVSRLETIVAEIESGEIGLEDAVKKYSEGVALIARCKAILGEAEQHIEELNIKLNEKHSE